ncbi:hypothetical protein [Hymenobacter rubidus]|uniref:hypothetical protein n=1 Tax=Hymenobacter rubidus TaxID=1441626 RepID=UPI00191E88CC|nr:hypothetical protein [Hymenobacter rubidus]
MNPPKEVGLLRKLVSTARSVTTKQVALPLGILRLTKNLAWLEPYGIHPLKPAELAAVKDYYGRIRELPLEQERNYWAPDLLRAADEKLERITATYQDKLMAILTRIVSEAA